jgi:hypothetical protein
MTCNIIAKTRAREIHSEVAAGYAEYVRIESTLAQTEIEQNKETRRKRRHRPTRRDASWLVKLFMQSISIR